MSGTLIMGIDPGSIVCGYGFLEKCGNEARYISSGQIELPRKKPLSHRLRRLYDELSEIVASYSPEIAVIEKVFFAKGYKAALYLGHARGIAILTLSSENIPIVEYSALEVKKAVVGYGKADKKQVTEMIRAVFNIKTKISHDSADALALALCHLNTKDFNNDKTRII